MGAEIDFASTFMAANIFSLAIVIGFNIADGGSQNGSQFPLLRDTEHCYHFISLHFYTVWSPRPQLPSTNLYALLHLHSTAYIHIKAYVTKAAAVKPAEAIHRAVSISISPTHSLNSFTSEWYEHSLLQHYVMKLISKIFFHFLFFIQFAVVDNGRRNSSKEKTNGRKFSISWERSIEILFWYINSLLITTSYLTTITRVSL